MAIRMKISICNGITNKSMEIQLKCYPIYFYKENYILQTIQFVIFAKNSRFLDRNNSLTNSLFSQKYFGYQILYLVRKLWLTNSIFSQKPLVTTLIFFKG